MPHRPKCHTVECLEDVCDGQVTVIRSSLVRLPRPFTLTGLRIYPQSWPGSRRSVSRPVLAYPVFIACDAPSVSAGRDVVGKNAPQLIPVDRYDAWSAMLASVFTDNNGRLWPATPLTPPTHTQFVANMLCIQRRYLVGLGSRAPVRFVLLIFAL